MSKFIVGECLDVLREMDSNSVDLVFCSPPYEDARTYGIDYKIKGDEWVEWAADRYCECVRVCRGLVAWVVEGKTRNFRYSATPLKLAVELDRRGVHLRKPPVFHRVGIPGSGGPDWWRNDYEFVICGTSGGKLPWSDNTATGHPPKWSPGGPPSHRKKNGDRVNCQEPKVQDFLDGKIKGKLHTKNNGSRMRTQCYTPPKKANPGNVIKCTVGKGNMGDNLAHENEAPFPESLVLPFVLSFCPPGGIVLDPFCGSGTTVAVAERNGRQGIGVDIRESQVDLSERRTGNKTEESRVPLDEL